MGKNIISTCLIAAFSLFCQQAWSSQTEPTQDQIESTSDQKGDMITAGEIDAIRTQINRCWQPHPIKRGAKGKDLVVDIEVKIEKDGTVIDAEVVDKDRINSDVDFRAAAEYAMRAILDPKCNRLPLNPDKYDQWKELTISFDPKDRY